MIRRPFFALVGLGVGVTLGVWTARRLDRARQAIAPGHVAARAGAQAGAVGGRLSAALAAGREAAAMRESELRTAYGVGRAQPSAARLNADAHAPGG